MGEIGLKGSCPYRNSISKAGAGGFGGKRPAAAASYQKKPKDSNPTEPDGQGRKKQSRSRISGLRERILSPKSCDLTRKEEEIHQAHRFPKAGAGGLEGGWSGAGESLLYPRDTATWYPNPMGKHHINNFFRLHQSQNQKTTDVVFSHWVGIPRLLYPGDTADFLQVQGRRKEEQMRR
ncbi:hypothetical protein SLEP1_g24500 [Rubroshorea leprosula]|uniref:Uncharacterized protein n=1 Tax=Rubroshorea leprosula TaxID=152421 RepID=A0AAV5JS00_9ROSI|nr:hypothetical protein SLEP1_g24500 [Rubroshorea leprosula]